MVSVSPMAGLPEESWSDDPEHRQEAAQLVRGNRSDRLPKHLANVQRTDFLQLL
jgi:hypothetical protein